MTEAFKFVLAGLLIMGYGGTQFWLCRHSPRPSRWDWIWLLLTAAGLVMVGYEAWHAFQAG
jgi:hypothetical protein